MLNAGWWVPLAAEGNLQVFCDGVFTGLVVGQGAVCVRVPACMFMKSIEKDPLLLEWRVRGSGRVAQEGGDSG